MDRQSAILDATWSRTTVALKSEAREPEAEAPPVPTIKTTSITTQLTTLILVTSSLALLLAYLAFVGYDLMTYRQSIATKLSLLAEVTAGNTLGALAFQDQEAARLALSTLSADPHIEYAALLGTDGQPFAEHTLPGVDTEEILARSLTEGVHATAKHMTVIRPSI